MKPLTTTERIHFMRLRVTLLANESRELWRAPEQVAAISVELAEARARLAGLLRLENILSGGA